MSDIHPQCKCIDHDDKRFLLKIIEEAITRENKELSIIEARRLRELLKPPFVGSFVGVRSSLVKVRKAFIQDMVNLKKRIEEYPKCLGTS